MAAQQRPGSGKPPGGPVKHPSIPAEWRIELPTSGRHTDSEFGGCRSIEAGYDRGPVLGQGTYGEVFLATDLRNRDKVAAKKIKMDNEKEGFPITAIREIKILSALAGATETLDGAGLLRNNVIGLREIVRSSSHKANNFKGSIYMIFDYMDHDMTGLLDRTRDARRFTAAQVKCYLKQLFCGLALLLNKDVLHRDLKNANLLVNNKGELKIADFGLARYLVRGADASGGREGTAVDARMTTRVITLWYRPPELFMGAERYGTEVDMWSAGCIMFELLTGRPLFPGKDEPDQLDKILSLVGQPSEATMPKCFTYRDFHMVRTSGYPARSRLREHCKGRGVKDDLALDLLEQLLCLDPAARITAVQAVTHKYFFHEPLPCKPADMPQYPSSHEMTMKRARHEQRYGGGQQQQQQAQGPRSGQASGQPPAQRQRTQGGYGGPQGGGQGQGAPPYGGGQQGGGGQQPYRGGAAPAAGMAPPGHPQPYRGGAAGMQPVIMTQAQVAHMMAGGQGMLVGQPGAMGMPLPAPGYGGYGGQAARPPGFAAGQGAPGLRPHLQGGGAKPDWATQRR